MSKIIITADIHNGMPSKLRDTIWSMQKIRQYASENNINDILILGDMFHDRINMQIDMLNAVYDFLDETTNEFKQNWISFPGNHDLFLRNSWNINAVHVFRNSMKVIENITSITILGQKFWILPFMHYESEYMNELAKINQEATEDDILLTHIGVNNAIRNECFLLKHWSLVHFGGTKFKRVFTGHFHCHQIIEDKIVYPGSPLSFRFDEGLVDHGFIVYDINEDKCEFVNIYSIANDESYRPPDYITVVDTDLLKNIDSYGGNNVRVVLSKNYTINELDKIKSFLSRKGADSISWKLYERQMEIDESKQQESGDKTPDELFKTFVEQDKPKLNMELLFKLHDQITKEAEERVVVESDD